jgi:hypothetical protein
MNEVKQIKSKIRSVFKEKRTDVIKPKAINLDIALIDI